MKVFFSMSFRSNLKAGRLIYQTIRDLGHTHTSTCFEEDTPEKFYDFNKKECAAHYERIFSELTRADIVIVEATLASLTIGQIIQEALNKRIPILALCQKGKQPFFLEGIEEKEERLLVMDYTESNLVNVLKEGLSFLESLLSVRFTLVLPRSITNHLDDISKEGISRSEYIRNLIRKDMERKRK